MKVGDLVEYKGVHEYGPIQKRQLGTIIRMDLSHTHAQYYIIWHTSNNEGWWSGQCLGVVSSNESR
jgi:hypothetical protein